MLAALPDRLNVLKSSNTVPFDSEERYFDASLILSWRVALEALGVPTGPLLKAAGLPEHAGFRDERFALTAYNLMLRELDRLHGARAWGILVAEHSNVYLQGLLGMFMRNCPTIADVNARIARYHRIFQEVYTPKRMIMADSVVLRAEYTVPANRRVPAAVEYGLAAGVMTFRTLLGEPTITPLRATFCHTKVHSDEEASRRVFGLNVTFGAEFDEIAYPREWFERPIVGAVPSLLPSLENHAERLVASLPPVGAFATVVRTEIERMLSDGEPTVQALAKRLRLSARTLQRRLASEGVSVTDLIDSTRRQIAVEMLSTTALPITSVAFMTGFADSSGFHRAFVRWEGVTPGEFRSRALAAHKE